MFNKAERSGNNRSRGVCRSYPYVSEYSVPYMDFSLSFTEIFSILNAHYSTT